MEGTWTNTSYDFLAIILPYAPRAPPMYCSVTLIVDRGLRSCPTHRITWQIKPRAYIKIFSFSFILAQGATKAKLFVSNSHVLNPIWPGLFWCIRYRGGGHIVPPLNIFGLGRVRVPILFGNYLPRSYLPYTKGFMKFGCPEPSKKMFDFWNFCSPKRHFIRFVRVPP